MFEIRKIIENTLRKGFLHLFSANLLVHIIEFASQLFVAFILFEADIGRIKSFQSFAAIALIFANFGFNTSTLKLASEKRSIKNKEQLFSTALYLTFFLGIITWVIIYILSYFQLVSNDLTTNKLFVYYAFSIPALALNSLSIAYIQALKKFKEVSILLVILRIIQVAIIIIATYLYHINGFIGGIVVGFSISAFFLLKKTNIFSSTIQFNKSIFLEHWKLAKFSFLGNLVSTSNLYLDIILLNHLTNQKLELGFYGMALTLMTGLRVLTNTVQQYLTPYYSENSNNRDNHLTFFKKTHLVFIVFALIVSIIIIIISPFFIKLIFNHKYDQSIFYFQILTVSWFFRSTYSLIGIFYISISKININFINSIIILSLSTFPLYYLISNYGVLGAAYSQILTAIIGAIVVYISLIKHYKFTNEY